MSIRVNQLKEQIENSKLNVSTILLGGACGTGKTCFIDQLKESIGEGMVVLDFLNPTEDILDRLFEISFSTQLIAIDHLDITNSNDESKSLARELFKRMKSTFTTMSEDSSWKGTIVIAGGPNGTYLYLSEIQIWSTTEEDTETNKNIKSKKPLKRNGKIQRIQNAN